MKHIALVIPIVLFFLVADSRITYSENPYEIGVITALSGGMATIGTAVSNGIELARKDRPELFKNIQFSYEDDQFDPKQSITAYRKLKSSGHPFLIFGMGTLLAQAIGPTVERDRIPLINFNFEAAPAIGKQFILRSFNHTDQYMQALARHLQEQGHESFPIVQTEASFLNAMVSSFQRALGPDHKIVEAGRVLPNEMDFRVQILKLKNMNQKIIGVFLWPDQLLAFFKQARELGLSAEYFGTDLCETAATLSRDPSLVEGCVYPDNESTNEFRIRYQEEYGNESQLTFAGSAYDMTILIGELLQNQNELDSSEFVRKLTAVKEQNGVLGSFSYKHDETSGQYFEYPIRIKRIEKGRGVSID
jgi:branched-chain amino acid transport system substrate-binding protein